MTIGRKLYTYRKLSGFTQQQIAEQLNISAQAVSKWENDQAEPDLATMRVLAGLYKVSVDEMLDPDSAPYSTVEKEAVSEQSFTAESAPAPTTAPVGVCKRCGVTVNEENAGQTEPVVLCQKCLVAQQEEKKRADAQAKRQAEQKLAAQKATERRNRGKLKGRIGISTTVAALVAIAYCVLSIISGESFSGGTLALTVVGTYVVFSFVWCMFYDCIVQDVVIDWASKSVSWPGLIFEFDLDGILWLIMMKLLFWFLGILLGLAALCVGVLIGGVCAPFVFPFLLGKVIRTYKTGTELE